jgi:hypothetical protein
MEQVNLQNLNKVKQFIRKCKEKEHYQDLKLPDEKFKRWKEDNSIIPKYAWWIIHESNCPSLVLNIPVPYKEMAAEAEQFIGRYIKHRGSWNPGWSSIAVHGQSADRTQPADYYIEEGIDTEENSAPYDWTSIAKDCPVTVDWLKNTFPIKQYQRCRFMLLEPGGYIQPHRDFHTRAMAAFNIALSNPPGIQFAQEDAGLIPWQPGEARSIDIGRKHSVLNRGLENRIHMIVHGKWGDGFERCIIESFEQLLINIGHINN